MERDNQPLQLVEFAKDIKVDYAYHVDVSKVLDFLIIYWYLLDYTSHLKYSRAYH
jgi:hypothetical protein